MSKSASKPPHQVHPRACGENNIHVPLTLEARGSSPRMRGKPGGSRCGVRHIRFIPAHAGKTRRRGSSRSQAGVHPRACGENSFPFLRLPTTHGSSPRMRGKQAIRDAHACRQRFIPAHAGKTTTTVSSSKAAQVHPRACGENQQTNPMKGSGMGSSPRMRGKRPEIVEVVYLHEVHPRACGENNGTTASKAQEDGSSPRMRGKRGFRL